jgi:hypothetical protein
VSRNPSHRLPRVHNRPPRLPTRLLLDQMGSLDRHHRLLSVVHAPDPGVTQSPATHTEHRPRRTSCRSQDHRDHLRPRPARISPRHHPANPQRPTPHRRHSRTDQHKPRWATTHRIQRPPATTRNEDSGNERGGRSRRWRRPYRGASVAPPPLSSPPPTPPNSRQHSASNQSIPVNTPGPIH